MIGLAVDEKAVDEEVKDEKAEKKVDEPLDEKDLQPEEKRQRI